MTEKGMRLVAMIEEKENGQYDVVNFLPDLKIKHIQGKEFEVIEEKDHIQIPYAQGINDLTVIVGENGVGKTRLVNDIFSLDEKKMFVFKNLDEIDPIYKGKHTYYNFHILNERSRGNNECEVKLKGENLIEWNNDVLFLDYFNRVYFRKNVVIVKLSNAVEIFSPVGKRVDLSTSNFLKETNLNQLLLLDMEKQIRFLLSETFDAERLEELLEFSGKKIKLDFDEEALIRGRLSGAPGERIYLEELEKFNMNQFQKIEDRINFYLTDYFANIYSRIKAYDFNDESFEFSELFNRWDSIIIENRDHLEEFLKEINDEAGKLGIDTTDSLSSELQYIFERKITLKNEITRNVKKAIYKFRFYNYTPKERLKSLKNIVLQYGKITIDRIDELFNISCEKTDATFDLSGNLINKSLTLELKKTHTTSIYMIKEIEQIMKLLTLQIEVGSNTNFLLLKDNGHFESSLTFLRKFIRAFSLKWQGLSSGQLALLNLFGRLHSLAEEVKDKESILLLLDEVDLGLHPEWQRKWISTALPIIGEIFKGKYVQIILTTHSPIMLSDIYGENMLMLRKDPETGERQVFYGGEVTSTSFGQNIHQLFKESFFLEQTKGDYSLKVINATIKAVYDLNQEGASVATIKADFASELGVGDLSDGQFRAYLEKVIGAIGEKVIAQKLQDMYQTIPLWSQASSLEGKRAGDLSTEELRQLLRKREEAGQ